MISLISFIRPLYFEPLETHLTNFVISLGFWLVWTSIRDHLILDSGSTYIEKRLVSNGFSLSDSMTFSASPFPSFPFSIHLSTLIPTSTHLCPFSPTHLLLSSSSPLSHCQSTLNISLLLTSTIRYPQAVYTNNFSLQLWNPFRFSDEISDIGRGERW